MRNRISLTLVLQLTIISVDHYCHAFSSLNSRFQPKSLSRYATTRQVQQRQLLFNSASSDDTEAATTTSSPPQPWTKSITTPGSNEESLIRIGDVVTLNYACYDTSTSTSSTPPFCHGTNEKFVVGDGSMIPGWDLALRTMRRGEACRVTLHEPDLAYGVNGCPPLVSPNAVVEMELQVLKVEDSANNQIDFDTAFTDSTTPRTAADIAAAYAARQKAAAEQAAASEELTGLEAFIAKAKNFYFFGLFEGETGERPPWFLRPSITFPLAFLIVGGAFYVSLAAGGISERGAPVVDELDEFVLSTSSSSTMLFLLSWFQEQQAAFPL